MNSHLITGCDCELSCLVGEDEGFCEKRAVNLAPNVTDFSITGQLQLKSFQSSFSVGTNCGVSFM